MITQQDYDHVGDVGDVHCSEDTSSSEEVKWTAESILQILQQEYPHVLTPDQGILNTFQQQNPSIDVFKLPSWQCSIDCDELLGGCENESVKISIKFSVQPNGGGQAVSLPLQTYIFRIYNDLNKSKDYIGFELSTLFFLGTNQFSVPYLIFPSQVLADYAQSNYSTFPDMHRAILKYVDGRFCAMFTFVYGYHVAKDHKSVAMAQQIATFIGSLHKLTQNNGFSMLDRVVTPKEMYKMKEIEKKLTFRYLGEALKSVLEKLVHMKQQITRIDPKEFITIPEKNVNAANKYNRKVAEMLDALFIILDHSKHLTMNISEEDQLKLELALPQAILHGDIHENNVLFQCVNGYEFVSGVVDWDDCYYGPQIMDFIKGFFFWCISKTATPGNDDFHLDVFDDDIIKAYKTTYENTRGFKFTMEERNSLLILSQMIFYSQIDFFVHDCTVEELFVLPNLEALENLEEKDMEPYQVLLWFTRIGTILESKIESLKLN